MIEALTLKLILIAVLILVAHDINIISLARQKINGLKSAIENPAARIIKIYQSFFIH